MVLLEEEFPDGGYRAQRFQFFIFQLDSKAKLHSTLESSYIWLHKKEIFFFCAYSR